MGLTDVARLDALVVHRRIRHLELARHGDGVAIFCTLVVSRLSENARQASNLSVESTFSLL
jgi:hypothetical protein